MLRPVTFNVIFRLSVLPDVVHRFVQFLPGLLQFLQEYVSHETVELFVVGHPKQMDNTDSANMRHITPFVASLKRKFPDIPVVLYDERFTSVLAHKALIEGGAKKKTRQDKALIDNISATLILTSYMEQQRNLRNK